MHVREHLSTHLLCPHKRRYLTHWAEHEKTQSDKQAAKDKVRTSTTLMTRCFTLCYINLSLMYIWQAKTDKAAERRNSQAQKAGAVVWRNFEDARAFVHGALPQPAATRTRETYRQWSKSDDRPADIPSDPSVIYREGAWVGWPYWLNAGPPSAQAPNIDQKMGVKGWGWKKPSAASPDSRYLAPIVLKPLSDVTPIAKPEAKQLSPPTAYYSVFSPRFSGKRQVPSPEKQAAPGAKRQGARGGQY